MGQIVNIGIIGDYNESASSHPATNAAITHSAECLSVKANVAWLPTSSFPMSEGKKSLEEFDAFWVSGGTYQNPDGVLNAIRLVRETDKPLIGT